MGAWGLNRKRPKAGEGVGMDLQTYGGPVLKLPWKEAAGFVRAAELRLYVKKAASLLPPLLCLCFPLHVSCLLLHHPGESPPFPKQSDWWFPVSIIPCGRLAGQLSTTASTPLFLVAVCSYFPQEKSASTDGFDDLPHQTIPGIGARQSHQEDGNSLSLSKMTNDLLKMKATKGGAAQSTLPGPCWMPAPSSGLWDIIKYMDFVAPFPFLSSFVSLLFNSFISKKAFPVYNLSKTLTNDISRGILIVHAAYSIHNTHLTESIT